jgi:protocatechuate 3,4-dioxygenase beta subunit
MTDETTKTVSRRVAGYRRDDADAHPSLHTDAYVSTRVRAPDRPLVPLPHTLTEVTGPVFGHETVAPGEADLTTRHEGEPLGERIIVHGRLLDGDGRPVRHSLLEIWQANAAGRYRHVVDRHPAPLDPNFSGAGRCLTDDEGRYAFTTIKPGAYPWGNHPNAWRPAHIHFSVFGPAFATRLVTQMYFPGDPLFPLDPIYNTIWRQQDRDRLIGLYDHDLSVPEFSMGYRFDIVVDGPDATWFEPEEGEH